MGEIFKDLIIEKDLEVEIVEPIKEEIIEEVVNDLDEVKLDDCNVQASIIFLGDTKTKLIDFIGVDRFDSIVSSYLVNLYNYMKTKEKEIQVDSFSLLMSCKYRKKIKCNAYAPNITRETFSLDPKIEKIKHQQRYYSY